jgi:hypothetical protein
MLLGISGLLAGAWYFWPQVYDSVRHTDRLTVCEGLPHPMYEEETFQEELRTKPTIQLSGFPFYREPLDLKPEDIRALRGLLGDRSTYRPYSGEKKCGGFHPDYAVEWSAQGRVYRCLICFGCFEARFEGPQGESYLHDLRREVHGREVRMRLLDVLKVYRKNRPPHERFGIGPLASAPAADLLLIFKIGPSPGRCTSRHTSRAHGAAGDSLGLTGTGSPSWVARLAHSGLIPSRSKGACSWRL